MNQDTLLNPNKVAEYWRAIWTAFKATPFTIERDSTPVSSRLARECARADAAMEQMEKEAIQSL